MCGIYNYGRHRSRDCPINWGKDPRSLEPICTIDGEYGHKPRWRTAVGDRKIGIERIDAPLPTTRKVKIPGNATGSPVKEVRGWVASLRTRPLKCWTCGVVGHFSADCQRRRCWHCWGTCPHKRRDPPRLTSQDRNKPQRQRSKTERHYHPSPIPTRGPLRREMGPRKNKESPCLVPASRWPCGEANRKEIGNGR